MSYLGISIKDAISSINKSRNGWFLPAIQRPYVWGSRYENELYICKLFDSIIRGYPIGGLIIWNTAEEIPYREFIRDYLPSEVPKLVDKGLHSRSDKWLIYDGQQRLQTLYSCLKYTFNNKVLTYNLLYNLIESHDPDETGFSFVPRNAETNWHNVRMNELFSKYPDDDKRAYRKNIFARNSNITDEDEYLIEGNIDNLWDIFVKNDTKSLAYFPVKTNKGSVVNEVFERLNTGGMALSQADLLFSKIKADAYDFEESLQACAKKIYDCTGKGYLFNAYNILQVINLLVKKTARIDPDKVKNEELNKFIDIWRTLESPLLSFFTDYLWGQFRINNSSIVPRQLALLPILVYFYEVYKKGYSFKHFSSENLRIVNQYFIKSQVNDWNLQTYADNFSREILRISAVRSDLFDFPLIEFEDYISKRKQRNIEIYEDSFVGYKWFTLKILTPERIYQFEPDMKGRFSPEIDHVFPKKLPDRSPEYYNAVDIIWNMQPTKGEINAFKTNLHPRIFFMDDATNSKGDRIVGSKYLTEYDFLFPIVDDGSINLHDPTWDAPLEFIKKRREMMIAFLNRKYGLTFSENNE